MYRLEVKFQGKWYKIMMHHSLGVYKLLNDGYVVAFVKESAINDIRVLQNEV